MTSKSTPQRPRHGGSYIRNPDGSLTRKEWTRQPGQRGDPTHQPAAGPPSPQAGRDNPAAPDDKAPAKPAAGKGVKET